MTPNASTMTIGAVIVSGLICFGFLTALVIAYMSKDQQNLSLLTGAVIANFSTAVSFWLGSSAGSQKKDEIISGAPAVVPAGRVL